MLTGDELRTARESAGLTQQQLGDAIAVSMRSVGNWERSPRVPATAERRVRRAFPEWFGERGVPLATVSDAQLLAEIARRFDRGIQRAGGSGGNTPAIARAGSAGLSAVPDPDDPEFVDPGAPLDAAAGNVAPGKARKKRKPGFGSQEEPEGSDG